MHIYVCIYMHIYAYIYIDIYIYRKGILQGVCEVARLKYMYAYACM
jgi:hypothetical protein